MFCLNSAGLLWQSWRLMFQTFPVCAWLGCGFHCKGWGFGSASSGRTASHQPGIHGAGTGGKGWEISSLKRKLMVLSFSRASSTLTSVLPNPYYPWLDYPGNWNHVTHSPLIAPLCTVLRSSAQCFLTLHCSYLFVFLTSWESQDKQHAAVKCSSVIQLPWQAEHGKSSPIVKETSAWGKQRLCHGSVCPREGWAALWEQKARFQCPQAALGRQGWHRELSSALCCQSQSYPGVLSLLSSFVHLHQAPFQFSCPAVLIFPCHFQKISFVSEPDTPDKIALPACCKKPTQPNQPTKNNLKIKTVF